MIKKMITVISRRPPRSFKGFNKRAVTLQELVFAVVVLIIIGLVAVIRLVNIPGKALGVQEQALINSLKKALIVYDAKYDRGYGSICTNPSDPNNCEIPFELLDNPPEYRSIDYDLFGTFGDGVWTLMYDDGLWYILSPHCKHSNSCGGKGCIWEYSVLTVQITVGIDCPGH